MSITKVVPYLQAVVFVDFMRMKIFFYLVSLSLVLEAAEVMEHFQWKSPVEIKEYVVSHKKEIGEELADVLYWVLLLAHDLKIDLVDAFEKKLEKNRQKYPVEKALNQHAKYDKL